MAYRYGQDETFTRAMDRGNYANAYETETLTDGAIDADRERAISTGAISTGAYIADPAQYRAGYVLGFFASYETHEVPADWQDEIATLRAQHPED